MMIKQFFQIFLILGMSVLFAACQNREADPVVEDADETTAPPTQVGEIKDVEIDEILFSRSVDDLSQSLSLISFAAPDDDTGSIATETVHSSTNGLVLSLNTSNDNGKKPDYTLLVDNDNVYSVNHATNKLSNLKHFKYKVCDIQPKEIVESAISGSGNAKTETYTTKHAEMVYVISATNDAQGDACELSNSAYYYYELPLNYKFDASESDDAHTDDLEFVNEILAYSQLIYGWVENPLNAGEYILDYGFLGYSQALGRLEFYDRDRQLVWSQPREIGTYPLVSVDGQNNSGYVFQVTHLSNYQYMIQLNQDVFVVDSSRDIFAKQQSDVSDILSDRIFRMETYLPYNTNDAHSGIYPVESYHDDNDLVLIDQGRIYSYQYRQNEFVPGVTAHQYVVLDEIDYSKQDAASRKHRTFSQFDYQECPEENVACEAAHDITSGEWQFVTDCELSLGCELPVSNDDYCETQVELDVSQSGADLCSTQFYQHIGELNNEENDARFVGFMQYLTDSINSYQASLYQDSLIFSTVMSEKDILVRYFYGQPLSAPKSTRETVLFGADQELFGLEHFIENDNMFVNALIPQAVRSNECYKNHQRVSCLLGSDESGRADTCTALDLKEGLCRNSFTEFESTALFCDAAALASRACDDQGINAALRVESESDDAKWVRLNDYSGVEADLGSMFLLMSDHDAALSAAVLNEGVLLQPDLYAVSDDDGSVGSLVGKLSQLAETPIGGVLYEWLNAGSDAQAPIVEGRLEVLSKDVDVYEGTQIYSRHDQYALVNTVSADNNAVTVRQAKQVASLLSARSDTSPKELDSGE